MYVFFCIDIQRTVELKHLKLTYKGPSCCDSAGAKWDELLLLKETQVDPFLLQQAIKAGKQHIYRKHYSSNHI